MLRAGRLRQRVSLMRRTDTRLPGLGSKTTWAASGGPIPAEVSGINGREAVIAQALQGVAYFKIMIRFRTDIGDADQLRYGDMDLNIRSAVDPDGRRQALEILADTANAEKTDG